MKKTIRDIPLEGKKILLRCDYNVTINGNVILDDTKITASLETIKYLMDNNCKIIILSHLGKVKTEDDKINNSLEIVSKKLSELLTRSILFSHETRGVLLEEKINAMRPQDILLVENTRYEDVPNNLESSCDEELSKYWASLADIFVNDAFGTIHRAHASNYGVSKYLPSVIGFLVEKELKNLNVLIENPSHPFTVIMGGAKIADKIPLIEAIIPKCDYLLLTGGIANTFLKALKFNIGFSLYDKETIPLITKLMLQYKEKLMLPLDVVVGNKYDPNYASIKGIKDICDNDVIYDIGPETLRKYKHTINVSELIFVNGTMGKYEDLKFRNGTKETYQMLAKCPANVIIGGGDSLAAIHTLGFNNNFSFLSTGGGATLDYIANPKLKSLENIEEI